MISFEDALNKFQDGSFKQCIEYENAWWFGPIADDDTTSPPVYGGDFVVYKKDGTSAPFALAGFDNSMGKEIGRIPINLDSKKRNKLTQKSSMLQSTSVLIS